MTVAARYVPTGGGLQVGGDWYDMIPLPSGRFAAGHRRRPGPRRAGRRADGPAADRPAGVRLRGPPARRGALPRLPLPVRAARSGADAHDEGGPTPARASRPACTWRSTRPPARWRSPAPATPTGGPDARRHGADAAHRGRAAAGHRPGHRLPDDPARPGARRDDDAVHGRAHRDRRARPGHRLGPAADGPGGRTRTAVDLEELADTLVQAVHGPGSHHTTGPLADRREDDIAVLLLRREDAVRRGPAGRRRAARR